MQYKGIDMTTTIRPLLALPALLVVAMFAACQMTHVAGAGCFSSLEHRSRSDAAAPQEKWIPTVQVAPARGWQPGERRRPQQVSS